MNKLEELDNIADDLWMAGEYMRMAYKSLGTHIKETKKLTDQMKKLIHQEEKGKENEKCTQ